MRQTTVTITFDTGIKDSADDSDQGPFDTYEKLVERWLNVCDNDGVYVYGRVIKVETSTVEIKNDWS